MFMIRTSRYSLDTLDKGIFFFIKKNILKLSFTLLFDLKNLRPVNVKRLRAGEIAFPREEHTKISQSWNTNKHTHISEKWGHEFEGWWVQGRVWREDREWRERTCKKKKSTWTHKNTYKTHRISATIILVPLSQTLREMGQGALDCQHWLWQSKLLSLSLSNDFICDMICLSYVSVATIKLY